MKEHSYGIIPVKKVGQDYLFLLIQHNTGHWSFPKGHPNPGETHLNTALRELKEETGINNCRVIDKFEYLEQYSFKMNGINIDKNVSFYVGLVGNEKIILKTDEVQAFKWLKYSEAREQLTHNNTKSILEKVYLNIKNAASTETAS